VVIIFISRESPAIEDKLLYSEQQVALNPTNKFRLSFVNEYVTVSGCEYWLFFIDEPLSRKHPPCIVFEYLRLPNSFFSQLKEIRNNTIGINSFFIRSGLEANEMYKIHAIVNLLTIANMRINR